MKANNGLKSCYLIQLLNAMAFTLCTSSFLLYVIHHFHYDGDKAALLVGQFFILNYFTHLLSGAIAGRLASPRSLMMLGHLLQLLGGVFLFTVNTPLFFICGMCFMVLGTGILIPNLYYYINIFSDDVICAESSVFINFVYFSIGAFVASALAGYLLSNRYDTLVFFALIFVICMSLSLFMYYWRLFDTNRASLDGSNLSINWPILCLLLLMCLCVFFIILSRQVDINGVIYVASIVGVGLIVLFRQSAGSRWGVLFVLYFCVMLINSLFFLGHTLVMYFLSKNVNLTLFHINLHPAWFSNFTGIAFVGGGLIIFHYIKSWQNINGYILPALKIAVSGLLASCALSCLPLGIYFSSANGIVNSGWLIAYFSIMGLCYAILQSVQFSLVKTVLVESDYSLGLGIACYLNAIGSAVAIQLSHVCLSHVHPNDILLLDTKVSSVFCYFSSAVALVVVLLLLIQSKFRVIIKR